MQYYNSVTTGQTRCDANNNIMKMYGFKGEVKRTIFVVFSLLSLVSCQMRYVRRKYMPAVRNYTTMTI